jgi:hypothetical protein
MGMPPREPPVKIVEALAVGFRIMGWETGSAGQLT